MPTFTIIFERANGRKFTATIQAPSLEDATIEASNMAEQNNREFLQIDEEG